MCRILPEQIAGLAQRAQIDRAIGDYREGTNNRKGTGTGGDLATGVDYQTVIDAGASRTSRDEITRGSKLHRPVREAATIQSHGAGLRNRGTTGTRDKAERPELVAGVGHADRALGSVKERGARDRDRTTLVDDTAGGRITGRQVATHRGTTRERKRTHSIQ